MEKETEQAAQVDPIDAYVNEVLDQDSEQAQDQSITTDSATEKEEVVKDTNQPKEEKPKDDGFQKRIDKVTADKYAEKRRADELQKWKDDQLAKQNAETLKKPTLADHEYDEEAFDKANVQYEIDKGVQDALAKRQEEDSQQQAKAESEKVISSFNERAKALGKDDFEAKKNAIPILPDGVADAILMSEDGAEMVYHLGSNLDKAEAIANMTPGQALLELGKISAKLSAKPEIKTSAAPAPIETLKSGSSLSSEIGDDISMEDWMSKFG